MSFVERGFRDQYAFRDNHCLNGWMRRTIDDKQRELCGKLKPPTNNQVSRPEAGVTMGSDMPPETVYNIVELLGNPLAQEWETAKRTIEGKNREPWFDACGLWKRSDVRPTVIPKQKASTNTRSVSIVPLSIEVEATASTPTEPMTITANTPSEGEHLPDVSTPTAEEKAGVLQTPSGNGHQRRTSLSSLQAQSSSHDD